MGEKIKFRGSCPSVSPDGKYFFFTSYTPIKKTFSKIPISYEEKIKGLEDLGRDDIRFINRQSGSGTRILLDYRLQQLGMDPAVIRGYENEEFTHMSVAVAVLSGTADVGLGIFAAAKALGLDFVPIVTEQYDLIIPDDHYHSQNLQILLEIINCQAFKRRVEALGGYSTQNTGEVIDIK